MSSTHGDVIICPHCIWKLRPECDLTVGAGFDSTPKLYSDLITGPYQDIILVLDVRYCHFISNWDLIICPYCDTHGLSTYRAAL